MKNKMIAYVAAVVAKWATSDKERAMKPNKQILPLIAAVVCMPILVHAHGLGKAGLIDADWTPVQIGAWPFSVFSAETKVYGVNVDLLGAYQESAVCGLTVAPINVLNMVASTDTCGVTIGLVSVMESHTGLLVSLASGVDTNCGLQVGVFSGTWNNCGVQFGVVNDIETKRGDSGFGGLQIGLFNNSDAISGLQIGLLNHNRNASIPWLPFANFSMR